MRTLAASALIVTLFVAATAEAGTWEYKVEEVDLITKVRVFADDQLLSSDELEGLLVPLGAEGWELVSVINRGGTMLLLVFKRPVADPPPPAPPVAPPPLAPAEPAVETLPAVDEPASAPGAEVTE
jgi:hypothetical protein